MYGVIGSKTRKLAKLYGAISSTTRKIKKVYGVVGGVTRLIYTSKIGYKTASIVYRDSDTGNIVIHKYTGNILGDIVQTIESSAITATSHYGVAAISKDESLIAYRHYRNTMFYSFYKYNGSEYESYGGVNISGSNDYNGFGDSITVILGVSDSWNIDTCGFSEDNMYFGVCGSGITTSGGSDQNIIAIFKNNGSGFTYERILTPYTKYTNYAQFSRDMRYLVIRSYNTASTDQRNIIMKAADDSFSSYTQIYYNSKDNSYHYYQSHVGITQDGTYAYLPSNTAASSSTKYQNKTDLFYINGSTVTNVYTISITDKYHSIRKITKSKDGANLYVSEHVEGGSSSSSTDNVCNNIYCLSVGSDGSVTYLGEFINVSAKTTTSVDTGYQGYKRYTEITRYPQHMILDETEDGFGLFFNQEVQYTYIYESNGQGSGGEISSGYSTEYKQGLCTLSKDGSGLITAISEDDYVAGKDYANYDFPHLIG